MNDDELRKTVVTLLVTWDPATQDHPLGWEWQELLECDVDVINIDDQGGPDAPNAA